jgi:hypothetical protein
MVSSPWQDGSAEDIITATMQSAACTILIILLLTSSMGPRTQRILLYYVYSLFAYSYIEAEIHLRPIEI